MIILTKKSGNALHLFTSKYFKAQGYADPDFSFFFFGSFDILARVFFFFFLSSSSFIWMYGTVFWFCYNKILPLRQ